MASFNVTVLAFISFLARSAYAASNECPPNKEMSCESLRSSRGYTYTVPPGIQCARTCEEGWSFQNGTFIVDSTRNANGKRLSIVVDVTPQNLTVSVCENLQWQIGDCECSCVINYTVTDLKHSAAHDLRPKNNTSGDEHDGTHDGNDLPAGVIAVITIAFVGVFILVILIWVKYCREPNDVL